MLYLFIFSLIYLHIRRIYKAREIMIKKLNFVGPNDFALGATTTFEASYYCN
jgi:hypothetical protein